MTGPAPAFVHPPVDPHAIGDRLPHPDERFDLVVVGAGPAGLAAAIEGARGGASVLLVDEHPVAPAHAGTDVPCWFGGRFTAALQAQGRMIEQVFAARPQIAEAFEAGVDVRLGVAAWGLYRNRHNIAALPAAMLGLADAERSWMVGYGALVLATGARDFALAFPGWDQPGVMGAQGLHALLAVYDAFSGRRLVVAGSGDLAMRTALLAHARGVDVAALVDIADAPQGSADLVAALAEAGIPLLTGHRLLAAEGDAGGVTAARVAPPGGGEPQVIACDTICLAIDTVPATELAEVAGAAAGVAQAGAVLPQVWLAGDCTGHVLDEDAAAAQGRAAARAALGLGPAVEPAVADMAARIATRAAGLGARPRVADVIVCQCEEVTRADLLDVQPPRYLPRPPAMAARSLATLLADGPPDQEQVKRLTRAGMGACQGRRCRDQVALLLAGAAGLPPQQARSARWRAPVRPIPLKVLADWQESEAMRAGWDVWFGIPGQWAMPADIGTEREFSSGNFHL